MPEASCCLTPPARTNCATGTAPGREQERRHQRGRRLQGPLPDHQGPRLDRERPARHAHGSVPLWSIKDMDVRIAVWQQGKDVGDVVLNLEDPSYGAGQDMFNLSGTIEGTTSGQAVLDNIEGPYAVLDILSPLISEARSKKTMERQSTYVHNMTPPAPYAAPVAPGRRSPTPAGHGRPAEEAG